MRLSILQLTVLQFSSISTPISVTPSRSHPPCLTSRPQARGIFHPGLSRQLLAARFASSIHATEPTHERPSTANPTSPTSTIEIQPQHVSAPAPPVNDEFTPSDFFDTLSDHTPQVSEHIGYLKELGLDYGWGPTAMIEWLLEHVYIYTGFPWWGSIVFTAIAVRLSLLKFYIDAADTSARMQALKPAMTPVMKRITQARMDGDRRELIKANQERFEMFKNAGIRFYKVAIPLVQVPLGFGTFRLLRGMSHLPVPGFDQGGYLWFKDLTLPDPFGVLPVVTSAMYFLAFKYGTQSGEVGAGMSASTIALFKYIIPVVTGFFSLFFPAALQLTLLVTSFFTVSQSYVFRQPRFRQLMNMHPIPTPRGPDPAKTTINVRARIKAQAREQQKEERTGWAAVKQTMETAVSDLQRKTKEMQGEYVPEEKRARRSEAEIKQAKAYEERRQKELAKGRFNSQLARKR